MMAADVNTTQLREPDPIGAGEYVDGGGKIAPPPPKGTHNLVATAAEWGADKEGYLQATLTAKVVAPGLPHDGHEIRYWRISTKRWPNRAGSSMGDFVRAHGVPTLPTDNAGYKAIVESLLNRPFEGGIDWEIYNGGENKNVTVKGMESFPDLPGGGKQDYVVDPANGKKVYARARVTFTVSKVK
jgi:hypothetical protein